MSLGLGVYAGRLLKSFLMFCILFRKNAAKSLGSHWSDMDFASCVVYFGQLLL